MISRIKHIKNKIRRIIPRPVLNFYHYIWALSGAIKYKFPSKNLIVIGVTGTKGKTTVCYLTHFLLQKLGIKTALSSSEFFLLGDEITYNQSRITTPGRWFLQKFLREAVNKKCEIAIIEMTSEGLMQNRHAFIDFDVAVFINIHPEHIEHHGGYEQYKFSKARLFLNLLKGANKYFRGKPIKKTIVANLDDKESDYFLSFPAQQKITFSLEINTGDSGRNINPEKFQANAKGIILKNNNMVFTSKLLGRANIYNILAGFAVVQSLGIPISSLKQTLPEFEGLPGRFEIIQAKGFKVIIDYAHTPVSIEELYKNIWDIFKPQKLLCLVGAAGGLRDKWKRPVIGEIAAKYCNKIIVSDEDPFDEDPGIITKSIEQGIKRYFEEYDFMKEYEIVQDRKEAISNLIRMAEKNDIVVLIGKGSEKSIAMNNYSLPWNEKEVVTEILSDLLRYKTRRNLESIEKSPLVIEGDKMDKEDKEKDKQVKKEKKSIKITKTDKRIKPLKSSPGKEKLKIATRKKKN